MQSREGRSEGRAMAVSSSRRRQRDAVKGCRLDGGSREVGTGECREPGLMDAER